MARLNYIFSKASNKADFRRGGGTLVALALICGALFFSDGKEANGAPVLRNTLGFLGKRSHSNVSGGVKSPVPSKRQRVEISTQGNSIDVNQLGPDDWILRTQVGNGGEVIISTQPPTKEGVNGHNIIFQITESNGDKKYILSPMVGSTGWHQNKNIIWTSDNQ